MKLIAKDQVHISSVKPETIRPGEQIEVSDAHGAELLKQLPHVFSCVDDQVKAEQKPRNKAEPAHANKAAKKGKGTGS